MANLGNTVDSAHINQNAAEIANYIVQFHQFIERNYGQWALNAGTAAQLTAAGVTDATQQYQAASIISSMNLIKTLLEGGTVSSSFPILNTCYAILGVD